jgi:uncharacterized protein YuzE
MNVAYFKDQDTLYIELLPETADHSWEAHPGVNINIAADGRIVGIEIENAADRIDMSVLRVGNFPGIVHSAKGSAATH